MGLLLKGGRVVDPVAQTIQKLDVLIDHTVIIEMAPEIAHQGHTVYDVSHQFVMPGLIDVHVHLREPGQTHKETIETGTMAAAAGGFSQVCAMPNTTPVVDSPAWVRHIIDEAAKYGYAKVHPIAAITKSSKGQELTEFEALSEAGAVGFSDDGKGVQSAEMMRNALLAAKALSKPVIVHAEDETLSGSGVINFGDVAKTLSVPGILPDAETAMIARDIVLAQAVGAHVHFCHVSPADAVGLIKEAKSKGAHVTAEVTPHHLLLTDHEVLLQGSTAKVNPPLRSETDRRACVNGLLDGTLDMIATDHAPHSTEEKSRDLLHAPFGFVGIETSFALMYTAFVHSHILSLPELVALMSYRPAKAFHLDGGRLAVGQPADIAVVDPISEKVVDPDRFYSKGKVTPFKGRVLRGWPVLTIFAGNVVYNNR